MTASEIDLVGVRTPNHVHSGPAAMREALGLAPVDDVLISLEAREIRLMPRDEAIRQAQAIVRELVPEGVSLADELIADRRREAAREAADD